MGIFENSCTALMFAVFYDRPDLVDACLDFKADPNLRNLEGKLALDYAMEMPANSKLRRSPAFERLKNATTARTGRGQGQGQKGKGRRRK